MAFLHARLKGGGNSPPPPVPLCGDTGARQITSPRCARVLTRASEECAMLADDLPEPRLVQVLTGDAALTLGCAPLYLFTNLFAWKGDRMSLFKHSIPRGRRKPTQPRSQRPRHRRLAGKIQDSHLMSLRSAPCYNVLVSHCFYHINSLIHSPRCQIIHSLAVDGVMDVADVVCLHSAPDEFG